ncbi:hypothetical protein [Isoptericola sp. NPDC057653]|uniref:hypothetical protein n=1 Tax=Isoptericola sp. NPDC057653 TaxID=3346195 RepID=UPI00368E9B0B
MRGARGRVAAVVTAWLVALGVVLTGAVAPVATAAEGESSTTVTLTRERWWQGEEIVLDIVVREGDEPASGGVRVLLDDRTLGGTQLTEGVARFTLPRSENAPGDHVLEVRHYRSGSTTPSSSATAALQILAPGRPVIPGTRVYGDPADVTVDLTGTDLPRSGRVELANEAGTALGAAALADGIATVAVPGTGMTPGRSYRMTLREAAGGTVLSTLFVGANVLKRPAALTVQTASTWRVGQPAKVTVRASSDLGPVSGTIEVRNHVRSSGAARRSAELVDGTAAVWFDPDDVLGTSKPDPKVFVELRSPFYAAPVTPKTVTVKQRYQTWVDIDTRSARWTYGLSHRVSLRVTAENKAKLDGKVTLSAGGRSLGSAMVVDGMASVLVSGTALEPGRRELQASFVPAAGTYDGSRWWVTQSIVKAKPSVRLSMDHTWYRVKAKLGSSEAGRVRVSTAGLPERGRLVLETRSPRAAASGWRTRWSADWALTAGDKGVQRVNVPATYLRTADGKPGKVYLRFRYVPSDSAHVSTVVSPAVAITRY